MRKYLYAAAFLAVASTAFAAGKIDAGAGAVFYGDTAGLNVNAVYARSLNEWGTLFGMNPSATPLTANLFLGAGLTLDHAVAGLSLLSIDPKIEASYRMGFGDNSPFNLYPYLSAGFPVNLFSNGNASIANGGFELIAGLKAGYSFSPKLEAGFGAEYEMNLTGMYIGSTALYVYVSYRPESALGARAINR